jgi:membrane fusion protein, multidrug efflux system
MQDRAFIVPSNVVLQQEGTNIRYLFTVSDGVAHRVNVKIGKRFDDKIEIISDKLSAGSVLVVEGQTKLSGEDKVKVVN